MPSSDAMIARAEAVVGAGHILPTTDPDAPRIEHLTGPGTPDNARPRFVVRPASVEELQAIVMIAGETGHTLWCTPCRTGNGASTGNPERPAVLLELSRMNRIVEFDPDSACALLEPGVTYDALIAHIESNTLPFWVDCEANGAHSVCGSICERAYGFTPYGDHLLMQCGMEVVLANGTVTRTGMGALPGSDTWQLFKYSFGPYLDGLFSRSDFAVVSKVGLWLMPAPPAYHPFMVALPDDAAMAAAVELLRPFKIDMTVPNTVVISHIENERALAQAAGNGAAFDTAAPERTGTLGTWNLYGALYGLPANVAFVWKALAHALASVPGARIFTTGDGRDDAPWTIREKLMRGVPAYSNPLPADGRMWFAASGAMEAGDARAMAALVADGLGAAGIGFQSEFALTWRTLLLRVEVPYDEADRAEKHARVLATMKRLSGAGYAITHDSPDLTRAIAQTQTGTGLSDLYGRLGRALDPAGTLGPRPR